MDLSPAVTKAVDSINKKYYIASVLISTVIVQNLEEAEVLLSGRAKTISRTIKEHQHDLEESGMTAGGQHLIAAAHAESVHAGDDEVDIEHVLLAGYDTEANKIYRRNNLSRAQLLENIERYRELYKNKQKPLDVFGYNLTSNAIMYDPIIGRDTEIEQLVRVLTRRTKNNPALIGQPGVGKSAIALGLAQRVANGDIPSLTDKEVIQLDVPTLVAGTGVAGVLEERMAAIIADAKERQCVLFVDELHTIVGAGGSGTQDIANMIKPSLARGELHMIGSTTLDEYRTCIEKDRALERRFQPLFIHEPTPEETLSVLRGIKDYYEKYHGVTITQASMEEAVRLAQKYVTTRFFPDKAIDIMDEASALVRLDNNKQVGTSHAQQIVANWTGIPVQKLAKQDKQRLKDIETTLSTKVIGQQSAISLVSAAIRRSRTGLENGLRPIGSFIFLGPTGVGKTELAKTLAWYLFDDVQALIRLDMSEFSEAHTVARLFGSPPGYVGYGEGGQLTEPVRRRPYSVVLLDEIEKAHPNIFNSLLQILDDGRMMDSTGKVVDFTNTIIVMTSNIAPHLWEQDDITRKDIEKALGARFRPEFINRLDGLAVFHHLGAEHIRKIADLRIEEVIALAKEQGITLVVEPQVRDKLAEAGVSKEFGARPLNREIASQIKDQLALSIAAEKVRTKATFTLNADGSIVINS